MNIFTALHAILRPTYNIMWPLCMLMLCSTLEIFGAGRYCYQFVNIRRQQDLSEWKLHLNPEYKSKLFVMKHIDIFGNNNKITFICFCITLSLMLIYFIGFILINDNDIYTTFVIITGIITYFSAACLDLYFTKFGQYFKFVDLWGISQQQKIGAFFSLFLVTFLLIILWIDLEYDPMLILTNSFCSILLLLFITQNVMIPFQIYKQHEKSKERHRLGNSDELWKQSNLFQTISNPQRFVLFMEHLYQEFSAENLLFVTVLIQFEEFLLKYDVIDDNMKLFDDRNYILPDCVPVSEFFQYDKDMGNDNYDIEKKIAVSCMAIYKKFIQRHHAQFEINISYQLSSKLHLCYNKAKEDGKLTEIDFTIFWQSLQAAVREVFVLLSGSHGRFKYYEIEIK